MSNSKLQGLVYDVLHQLHAVFLANSWAVYDGGEAKSRLHHLFGLNLDSELIQLFVECGFITIRENVPRFLLSRFNKWWINKSGKLDWSPGCREGQRKTYCLRISQARGVNFCSLDRPLQSVQHLKAYEGFKAIFREDRTTIVCVARRKEMCGASHSTTLRRLPQNKKYPAPSPQSWRHRPQSHLLQSAHDFLALETPQISTWVARSLSTTWASWWKHQKYAIKN